MIMPRMRLLLLVVLLAGVFACVRATDLRVVSQTVGTDELLLALAEPAQIAALSHYSRESGFSAVAAEAKSYPQMSKNADVESVLKYTPTLVLCANYSRVELVEQMRRSGVKVIVIDHYETLADAYSNLKLIARELGPTAEAKAETIIVSCEKRVAALRERLKDARPIRVIAPSTYGIVGGNHTTFQDLCDHAAAENLATTLGKLEGHAAPPNEQMLTWPVERVVVTGKSVAEALEVYRHTPPYQYMDVIKENRAVLIPEHLLSSVTHHRVDGYEELAKALHPELFP